jgi:hypothetical protein
VRLVRCRQCQHTAPLPLPLPLRDLIRRYGELVRVEAVVPHLRCEDSGAVKAELTLARLCEPGRRPWHR